MKRMLEEKVNDKNGLNIIDLFLSEEMEKKMDYAKESLRLYGEWKGKIKGHGAAVTCAVEKSSRDAGAASL